MSEDKAASSDIICGCFSVSVGDLKTLIKTNPDMTFDQLMTRTGAGTKCTACMLDLEYYFVSGEVPRNAKRDPRRPTVARSGKRRLYDLMDSFSPKRAYVSRTVCPIVASETVEEYLWIANRPLLFDDDNAPATPHSFDFEIRDAEGNVLRSERMRLPEQGSIRINLSEPLLSRPANGAPLRVGTVELRLWSDKVGHRGTTRPQIEILGPASACAVHTQAPSPRPEARSAILPCRPADERLFIAFMNPYEEQLNVDLKAELPGAGESLMEDRLQVPKKGARLYEIPAAELARGKPEFTSFVMSWNAHGGHKAYLLASTKTLDRFSVDHL